MICPLDVVSLYWVTPSLHLCAEFLKKSFCVVFLSSFNKAMFTKHFVTKQSNLVAAFYGFLWIFFMCSVFLIFNSILNYFVLGAFRFVLKEFAMLLHSTVEARRKIFQKLLALVLPCLFEIFM